MIELFEDFCVYLKTKKKISENTLASYRRDIKISLYSSRVLIFMLLIKWIRR